VCFNDGLKIRSKLQRGLERLLMAQKNEFSFLGFQHYYWLVLRKKVRNQQGCPRNRVGGAQQERHQFPPHPTQYCRLNSAMFLIGRLSTTSTMSPALFCFRYFLNSVLHFFPGWPGLLYLLHSWDHRHVPPCPNLLVEMGSH
jgi:hypothetical protein